MVAQTALFTRSLPVRQEFSTVLEDALYQRVPDDWLIAVTDVVGSRQAIANGQYKAVNMAGVAVISAVMNSLSTQEVPFIFGGDGAAVVCAPTEREALTRTLAATAAWVRDDLGLTLRAALVPVSVVRAQGFDVLVQTTRVSEAVNNFAFRGGGISQAEKLMKAGEFAVRPGPPGSRPDLSGLSCRWSPIRAEGAKIVSIIIEAGSAGEESFHENAERLLEMVGMGGRRTGTPFPAAALRFNWPPPGIEMEAKATRGWAPLIVRKAFLYVFTLYAAFVLRTGIKLGGFDPGRYKEFTSLNTDYRKFQDGLRITVSLREGELEKLTEFLERERNARHLRYGLCVQESAILTCYVPSVTSDSHFHFLDGAGGGYAQAAENMKS